MEYELTVGTKQAGKVQMVKEGLYYQITCHAQLHGAVMYRLVAVSNGKRQNLGILSPDGGGYSLHKKIPRKYLEEENLEFLLLPSHEPMEGKFVPLIPEEPFQYLQRLQDAYLSTRNGQVGVIIPEEDRAV